MTIPEPVKKALTDHFGLPDKKVYVQLATTIGLIREPSVRSMRLAGINRDGTLVFFTHTDTRKWKGLEENKWAAICMLSDDKSVQILAQGPVGLIRPAKSEEHLHYWENLGASDRPLYGAKMSNEDCPETFGVIIVRPVRWEILTINKNDIMKSSREKFKSDGESWYKHRAPVR